MSRIQKKPKEEPAGLCRELQSYDRAGIRLWLDGKQSTPEQIAKACSVREGKTYMRDYIRNEQNEVTDIAFDQIDRSE